MEAKDTVMSPAGIEAIMLPKNSYIMPVEMGKCMDLVKAQAEISFRAGFELGQNECPPHWDRETAIYMAGIKKVVDWLRWHKGLMEFMGMHHEEEWQAKLKEWGL